MPDWNVVAIEAHNQGQGPAGLIAALLFLPTLAVILQNYTGLIYSLEILAGLALVMAFTTRPTSASPMKARTTSDA